MIIAANRDEYYNRPTKTADYWEDYPELLGGIDEKFGGTWLGVTKSGKIGLLTNYRDPNSHKEGLNSRGLLLKEYLTGETPTNEFIQKLSFKKNEYNGYNLLFGSIDKFYYYSNRIDKLQQLSFGDYGLSNHLLDTSWPKINKGKTLLSECLNQSNPEISSIMEILKNREKPDDVELPETGIGLELERVLSPIFITSPIYGTRSSTVIMVDNSGKLFFREDTFNHQDDSFSQVEYSFQISNE